LIKRYLDGTDFMNMVWIGTQKLEENVAQINALNVFPVPDGDTGTNMNLTLLSGIREMKARASNHLGQTAEALSKGLLMGARGNSGVILSQLFRGFAKSVSGLEQATAEQLSSALQQGVEAAYQAVIKPVEGTILTVSKQAAEIGVKLSSSTEDIIELFQGVLRAAQAALAYTPEQLPILKQVGVVDAGGQGLVYMYEGYLQSLTGERQSEIPLEAASSLVERTSSPQSHISTDDIEYGYCTEFIISIKPDKRKDYNEINLRDELTKLGDSLLVVTDDDLVKIHIHAEQPGTVMNHAMQYGDLIHIKIENMREQHAHILNENESNGQLAPIINKPYGMLAVAMGEGISSVFSSLGVDYILAGEQTMNPSTEDFLQALKRIPADIVYIFPNNTNIILAAKQAGQLADKEVIVIPSKTIPQGITAVLSFRENVDALTNEEVMVSAMEHVRSGSITFAVRDSKLNHLDIRENDFLGVLDNHIVASDPKPLQVCVLLLEKMIVRGDELVTLYCGEAADSEWTQGIQSFLESQYPEIELEILMGGQPLYYYIISVE